jgi:hypothetical protein
VGERTFSWLGQSRRLAKEYERLCETSEAMIYASMSRIMLRRLAFDPLPTQSLVWTLSIVGELLTEVRALIGVLS